MTIDWLKRCYVHPSREDCAVFVLHAPGGPVRKSSSLWVNDKTSECSGWGEYIYFRWKQVHLFPPLQKLPVMLWNCLSLFISFSLLCGSSLLYPLFKVRLWMGDKVFEMQLSAAFDTASFTPRLPPILHTGSQLAHRRSYRSHHRIPTNTSDTSHLYLISSETSLS